MFTKFDLETIIIKILNDNYSEWFSQFELFDYLIQELKEKSYNFTSSKSELFIGHYLFVWEKLFINTNFIDTYSIDSFNFIKIKNSNESNLAKINLKTKNLTKLNVNLNEQISHMVDNPTIYLGSKLIKNFLININSTKYLNIYDIVLNNTDGLSNELICKFIDIYGNTLNINSNVMQYILTQPLEYREIKVNDYILKYLIKIKPTNITNKINSNLYNFNNLFFYSFNILSCSILYYWLYK